MGRVQAGPGKKLGRPPVPAIKRWLARVLVGDGCWEWQGPPGTNTYGQFSYLVDGVRKNGLPHRFAHEFFVGPIPLGFDIDHLCRNRMCVRPDHLEAVTRRENNLRSNNFAGVNARKTHCPQGHEYSQDNLIAARSGKRLCKACARDWARRNRKVS